MTSWSWNGFIGPGHGEPFYNDTTGTWYFASHIRDGADCYKTIDNGNQETWYMHYLSVRELVWVDGWPCLSPEMVYPNEAADQVVSGSLLEGNWWLSAGLYLVMIGCAVFGGWFYRRLHHENGQDEEKNPVNSK